MSESHKQGQQCRRAGERLLKMLRETGPRKRTVCVGLVGELAFEKLLADKRIRTISSRRGTKYGARA